MRWTGHAARTGEMTNAYNILVGIAKETSPHGDTDLNERIILRKMFMKYGVRICAGFNWLRIKCTGKNFLISRAIISISRRTLLYGIVCKFIGVIYSPNSQFQFGAIDPLVSYF
jgi:hypothetical protein